MESALSLSSFILTHQPASAVLGAPPAPVIFLLAGRRAHCADRVVRGHPALISRFKVARHGQKVWEEHHEGELGLPDLANKDYADNSAV